MCWLFGLKQSLILGYKSELILELKDSEHLNIFLFSTHHLMVFYF